MPKFGEGESAAEQFFDPLPEWQKIGVILLGVVAVLAVYFGGRTLLTSLEGDEPVERLATTTTTTIDPTTIEDPERRFHAQIEFRRVTYSASSPYEIATSMCDRFSTDGVRETAVDAFTAAIDVGGVPELLAVTRHGVELLCPEHRAAWNSYDSSTFG